MEIWIAAGDETGGWDIVDGSFGTETTGLAWVLGPISAWERALQMPLGDSTAAAVFSQPFAARLPDGVQLPKSSTKYHVLDVWSYCKRKALSLDVAIDLPQEDPVVELLRRDVQWILRQSGLGILATGGNSADAKVASLGLSGDGLRERARAFAGLMTVAIPFFPGDAEIHLLAEGRTESDIADAVKACRYAQRVDAGTRYHEPYRDFLGRLKEDLARAAAKCSPALAGGTVCSQFHCNGARGGDGLQATLLKIKGSSFLRSNAANAVAAMNGIADLAAALIPPPEGSGIRFVIPPGSLSNFWLGNFRELRDAFRG